MKASLPKKLSVHYNIVNTKKESAAIKWQRFFNVYAGTLFVNTNPPLGKSFAVSTGAMAPMDRTLVDGLPKQAKGYSVLRQQPPNTAHS